MVGRHAGILVFQWGNIITLEGNHTEITQTDRVQDPHFTMTIGPQGRVTHFSLLVVSKDSLPLVENGLPHQDLATPMKEEKDQCPDMVVPGTHHQAGELLQNTIEEPHLDLPGVRRGGDTTGGEGCSQNVLKRLLFDVMNLSCYDIMLLFEVLLLHNLHI